jgi:exodeoxyribonuclease V alpha subunit
LLGDKDQLASVEAGSVLGDLCRNAERTAYDAATRAWLQQHCGQVVPGSEPPFSALDQQIAGLRVSHRFDDKSGIGRLAAAVNAGQAGIVEDIWQHQPVFEDIRRFNLASKPSDFDTVILHGWGAGEAVGYRYYLELLTQQRPAVDAPVEAHSRWALMVLDAFDRFQILCALREGTWGVEGLNQRIAEVLFAQGLIPQTQGWYEGRPVLVSRNDYALGLMNGDIGIALNLPDAESGVFRLRVVFKQNQQTIKSILPSRLNEVESVYAMTVHKSQGSEFEHVALVMPDVSNPVLTRELIYTGITRARQRFSLLYSVASVLPTAITRRVKRLSGLADELL